MGDDPFIPVGPTASQGSSNATNYFINNLGKPSFTILVVVIGLALGLSVGALVGMAVGRLSLRAEVAEMIAASERRQMDAITASEKRAMDMAGLAKQEARIAQDKITYVEKALRLDTSH